VLNAASFTAATRLGFAARGVMYLVIGYLALRSGRSEDGSGALGFLSGGPAAPLLFAMAAGFFAYGLWRVSEAMIDSEGHGTDLKGSAARAGGAVSGLIHLGLGILAVKLASGSGGGGGSGGADARQTTADALAMPGGELLVLIAAAALGAVGAFQLGRAWAGGFLKHLGGEAARADWVRWLGRAGYGARGIVFLLMGWFLLRAGIGSDAAEAGGMGEALASLPDLVRKVVAAGLFLFGLFSFVEARYRRINDPRVLDRLAGALRKAA
jgi:hypothetical protein